ncbi:mechanosensitive ion channel family protein [Microvirga subterranea]|uniref:Small-conductance mechanosensitive channel n=1 Tax=Microvirga subterranea TaxID=186651 RepID=A0A370HH58_9HYPH|nr:mechanosensitive ion channel family protein [Microvirga subterranea]RDI57244.1 small-conductance mechanosensitive channel [Microvirga subterranea]
MTDIKHGARFRIWPGILLCLLLLIPGAPSRVWAQAAPAPAPPPPQVQELLKLLDDPSVREWMERQRQRSEAVAEASEQVTASEQLSTRVQETRARLAALVAAVPRMPEEFRRAAGLLSQELRSRPILDVVLLVLGFLVLGAGMEWLFGRASASARARIVDRPVETAKARARTIALLFALGLAGVTIFGLGSIGAFLVFDWPPLLRRIVLAYLSAAFMLRLVLLACRVLLAPRSATAAQSQAGRVVPISDEAARFWFGRIALFAGWFLLGWATVETTRTLGFSLDGRRVLAYALGIGLLVIAVEAVWRRPVAPPSMVAAPEQPVRHHVIGTWLVTLYLVLLWVLWVAGLMGLFWLAAVAVLLPQAIAVTKASVRHVLRPGPGEVARSEQKLSAVYVDRGIRVLLIAGAVLFLAYAWQIDLVELTSRDTVATRAIRGLLSSVVILLVADLIWQIIKTHIDNTLAQTTPAAPPGSEEALRQARLRTLLPIFRSMSFVVLAVVAVLMALSSLGVEIGPLIAGAGIVGVAVGFGSQTLVKDVISGVFYLLDDAFRVGEYIQSGSYKGTVEKLGFRSVKLRHQRGPIFTVPYGQLGAVQNMSRDWVIDKMTLNVTYDTDLDKAKKIIKQIGKELAADPEYAHNILEPLKMQGVEQFGEFAIELRMKMMTRPGEQFVIRRRAFALIKKAFDENGIKFAFPTVQVAGRDEVEPAAARQVLTLVKGKTPEEGA